MEEIKTKGIVIRTKDFKDSDKIVTIFSADLGLVSARVRGVKKSGAKLTFAVQPFALCEFMLIKSGDFYTCINATSIDQFFNIINDFDTYIFTLACLEVCYKTVKENSPEPELFLFLVKALKAVCYDGLSAMYVFIKFMLNSLKYLGFEIVIGSCACCHENLNENLIAFSYDYNGLICGKCANKNEYLELTKGEYAILKNIDRTEIENLNNLKFLSRNDLVSVISLLIKDFRLHTDEEIESIKKFL